ncbi:DUF2497 domain-containing protein [Novosphingobium sp. SG720]|uniref:DUF2497 domain-containing protein n=1 Tax=Novosphingobium sp. SG720 TaxID=2586998 RepID=UPI001446FE2A|nr:DUF2497 domain-containing protein [Novosphingobium sp. SG720]NKJ42646.1 hypothetical protein [Novosphingobium sp. SG720]
MRQAGEPSVEEILESIKKVIARDTRGEAPAAQAPRAPMSAAAAAAAIAPALQAQAGREGTAAPRAAANPAIALNRAASPADVLDLTDVAAQIMGEYRKPAAEAEPPVGEDDEEALVPQEAAASMRDSLAALAMLAQPGAQPQIVRSGETSLEGMVRDMLRPMLAQWLERNLPVMVEKMVAAEIARIAGKRG